MEQKADTSISADYHTIVLGNPGTGKSTLLNGLCGSTIFRSGISFGRGLTCLLQFHQVSEKHYLGDTPGLSDVELRKQAALEIERSLKRNGKYRLVFVVTLEEGRVRPDDATTIQLILDAVKSDVPFAVVVNKLSEPICNYLENNSDSQMKVMTALLAGTQRATTYFHPVVFDESLCGADNAIPPSSITESLQAFLKTVPYALVSDGQVTKINTESYDEAKDAAATTIANMEKDLEEMKTIFKEKMSKAQAEADQLFEKQQSKYQREISELERKQAEELRQHEQLLQNEELNTEMLKQQQEHHQKRMDDIQAALQEVKNRPPIVIHCQSCSVM